MYCISDFSVVIFSVVVILLIRLIILENARPILNIYRRPSNFYWLKVGFMYVILKLKQISDLRKEAKKTRAEKFEEFNQLEQPQRLSYHENAIDAVYFNAADSNGDHLLVSIARRQNRLVDGFIYLKIKESGLGLLESPKLPGTSLYQTHEEEGKYEVEGIKVEPTDPMKKWNIQYEGKMKKFEDRSQEVNVKLSAVYRSYLPHFNFDIHMDPLLMAQSMALESWSRGYFEILKGIHQTHYEQHGDITGIVEIDGKNYSIKMNSMRDHTFGIQRNWGFFHRYGLHFFALENGDRLTVGSICMPIAFSCLPIGYIYVESDKKIYPIESCDLQLYQHGENGNPPLEYAFIFNANKIQYTVQVYVVDSPVFYLSKDWESRIVERLCKFKVNGINGWGAAEWQYRNVYGKNVPDYEFIKN